MSSGHRWWKALLWDTLISSEENILSRAVLVTKVPQTIMSENSRGCWHNSLFRSICHRRLTLSYSDSVEYSR